MTAFYTAAEDRYLAAKRGEMIDLVVCSDGILRTAEDKAVFDAYNRPCAPVQRKLGDTKGVFGK